MSTTSSIPLRPVSMTETPRETDSSEASQRENTARQAFPASDMASVEIPGGGGTLRHIDRPASTSPVGAPHFSPSAPRTEVESEMPPWEAPFDTAAIGTNSLIDDEASAEAVGHLNGDADDCTTARTESPRDPSRLTVELFASGINGALNRIPKVQTVPLPLLGATRLETNTWRPVWSKVKTVTLTFPAGIEFQPPPKVKEPKPATVTDGQAESPADGTAAGSAPATDPAAPQDATGEGPASDAERGLVALTPPSPHGTSGTGDTKDSLLELLGLDPDKKLTRIKPPHDVLTLEDRLFYLLQPPLESWLKGQELIMPFEPFHYQYEGIGWLFSNKSALLADEMGLGKTMQTITALRLLLRAGLVRRVLLCCPKPLIPNWQREFKAWAEEIPLTTVEGDGGRRQMLWTMPGVTVLLCNYELVVRDMEAFGDNRPSFDLVILDEAQRAKNRGSRTAVTVRSIPRKRSWALTGTPIENRPEELTALYEYLEVVPPNATPDIKQLSFLAKTYILRRTKDLVMTDMPPRLDRDEVLDLLPAQRHAYDQAEKEGIVQLNEMGESVTIQHVFELVLRLKQITNFEPVTGESAKLERLEADMEEIAESGGKAILFSQWTSCIDYLEKKLERFGTLVYHGKIPTPKREPILAQFKNDPTKHLILMSYATGAVGLNLQFSGYVFLFDRWWNPAIEDQAVNRAHRIGQKSQVIVTRYISKDTIEEKIDRVLREKRELFRSILGEGDNTNRSLSMNASEIFGLFDLKARHGKETRKIAPKPVTD